MKKKSYIFEFLFLLIVVFNRLLVHYFTYFLLCKLKKSNWCQKYDESFFSPLQNFRIFEGGGGGWHKRKLIFVSALKKNFENFGLIFIHFCIKFIIHFVLNLSYCEIQILGEEKQFILILESWLKRFSYMLKEKILKGISKCFCF